MAESTGTRSRQRGNPSQARAVVRILIFSAILGVLVVACAEIAPPPGGEIDRTPPALLATIPAAGAVDVAISDRVVLQFSEHITPPRTGKAFFISPHLSGEPKVKWKGERVEIIFPDSFRTNQTYIISLSSGITDLRNNVFDSAGVIAFSTGPTLDSGRVAGAVYKAGNPQPRMMAALYDALLFADSAVWDSLYPTYLTQTNQQGEFSFAYLPDREYRLVVFEDRNNNEQFNPLREAFALSDRPVVVGGPLPVTGLRLGVTTEDTTSTSVLSAAFSPDRLVRVRLSRPVQTKLLNADPGNLVLRPLGDSASGIEAQGVLEVGEEETSTLTAWFGTLDSGLYRLELRYDADLPAMVYDSLAVFYREDRNPPQIVAFEPEGSQFLRDIEPRLVFSEPLDSSAITDETFVLWRDTDSVRVPLTWLWEDVFRLRFDKEELEAGEAYRLQVTEFDLKDRAGNVVGDSLREYEFSTLDVDSLGSIAGEVQIGLEEKKGDPVELTFTGVGKGRTFTWRGEAGAFRLDVPAGDYLLSGYIDSDGDERLSLGSVDPYRLAETQAVYADTIQVRARFETAGVEFVIE